MASLINTFQHGNNSECLPAMSACGAELAQAGRKGQRSQRLAVGVGCDLPGQLPSGLTAEGCCQNLLTLGLFSRHIPSLFPCYYVQ